jgi:hypothetical protein
MTLKRTFRAQLKCPKCRARLNRETASRETELYGDVIIPQAGDLTSCDGCGTILEYTHDPRSLTLRIAPQWRVDLLDEADGGISNGPSLSEIVEGVRNRKAVRVRDYFVH